MAIRGTKSFTGNAQRKTIGTAHLWFNMRSMSTHARPVTASASAPIVAEDTVAVPASTAEFDAGQGTMPTWSELVEQHADSVYRLAYRLSGNQHDAEDLTQDTFMRVFRSLKNYKPGTFEGWLHRITTNLFLDMVRRRSTIRIEALPEDYDRIEGTMASPEQQFAISHLDPALEKALDQLAPDFRVAVILCDVLGMSYDEIGQTLGVKMGTVRSRIHRARAQLRDMLERDMKQGQLSYIGG